MENIYLFQKFKKGQFAICLIENELNWICFNYFKSCIICVAYATVFLSQMSFCLIQCGAVSYKMIIVLQC